MAPTLVLLSCAAILAAVTAVNAESHTIRFNNQCGQGTPTLIIGGHIVSNGTDYTSLAPASGGIAYLQTGQCSYNGEKCAIVEFTLGNSMCPGCGSSTDISLIPPHELNVPVSFSYFDGCDGVGSTCAIKDCNTAFFVPDDNQVQVACQTDNVNLLITFCPDGTPSPSLTTPRSKTVAAPTALPATTHASSSVTSPDVPTSTDAGGAIAIPTAPQTPDTRLSSTSSHVAPSSHSAKPSAWSKTCKHRRPAFDRSRVRPYAPYA